MIVVHLNVYAISAADYLTSRTRSLADAVDAGFAGFTACPERGGASSGGGFYIALAAVGLETKIVAKVVGK